MSNPNYSGEHAETRIKVGRGFRLHIFQSDNGLYKVWAITENASPQFVMTVQSYALEAFPRSFDVTFSGVSVEDDAPLSAGVILP